MCCGRPPYNGTNHIELLRHIESREVVFPPFPEPVRKQSVTGLTRPTPAAPPVPALPSDCVHLLKGLLKRNPQERMGFTELFAHPFVRGTAAAGAATAATAPTTAKLTPTPAPVTTPTPSPTQTVNVNANPNPTGTSLQDTAVLERTIAVLPSVQPTPNPTPSTAVQPTIPAPAPSGTPLPAPSPPADGPPTDLQSASIASNPLSRPLSRASQQPSSQRVPQQPTARPPNPARSTISVVEDAGEEADRKQSGVPSATAIGTGTGLQHPQPQPMLYAVQPPSPRPGIDSPVASPSPPVADATGGAGPAGGTNGAGHTHPQRMGGSSHERDYVMVSGTNSQHQISPPPTTNLGAAISLLPADSPVSPSGADPTSTAVAIGSAPTGIARETIETIRLLNRRAELIAKCAEERVNGAVAMHKQSAISATAAAINIFTSQQLIHSIGGGPATAAAPEFGFPALLSAYAGAFVLYGRAVEICRDALSRLKQLQYTRSAAVDSEIDRYSSQFAHFVRRMQSTHTVLIDTYNAAVSSNPQPTTTITAAAPISGPAAVVTPPDQLTTDSVERMMFDWALQLVSTHYTICDL